MNPTIELQLATADDIMDELFRRGESVIMLRTTSNKSMEVR